jgi:PTH1 family peptidyl-tRNA hydrolase
MGLFGTGSGAEWLIAGLGNPEPKYDGTRHNTGFRALDALAEKWNVKVEKAKWQGLYGMGEAGGRKILMLKPLTYMNLSGQSIAPAAGFYKIPPDHVIVLCDDIAQQPGHIRIRPSGSAGGHNGLKSVIACLGTETFYRIRIGVGEKPTPEYDLADWVLGKLPQADAKAQADRLPDIAAACLLLMDGKLQEAQSRYNR